MRLDTSATKQTVLGITGMGKSCLVRQLVADVPRLIAHDPQEDYDTLRVDARGLGDFLEARYQTPRWRVGLYEGGHGAAFCAWAWAIAKRSPGLVVLIDEADMVAPPNGEPQGFKELCARGRHVDALLLAVARRPTEVSPLIRSQSERLYVFRTQHPPDVAYLAGIMGGDAARVLPTLQRFEFIEWTPAGWHKQTLTHPPGYRPSQLAINPGS